MEPRQFLRITSHLDENLQKSKAQFICDFLIEMFSPNQCWRCDRVTSQGLTCSKCHIAYYCSDHCSSNDEFRHGSDCKDVVVRYVCHGCRRQTTDREKMMMCSNCMKAWFCGQECQKKTWKTHKAECKAISTKVQELAVRLRIAMDSITGMHMLFNYYFGNSPALDLLNLQMNEGFEYSEGLRLLLCGVGDLRNVCLTISKLQKTHLGKVDFVLNDICACTLARAVFLLYMLCKGN